MGVHGDVKRGGEDKVLDNVAAGTASASSAAAGDAAAPAAAAVTAAAAASPAAATASPAAATAGATTGRGREELLDVLDERGVPTGECRPRSVVHRLGLYHRSVTVWLYARSTRQLLLQRRAAHKESWPDMWDASSAGHVVAGESSHDTALREVQEELGLRLPGLAFEFLFQDFQHSVLNHGRFVDNDFSDVFLVTLSDPLSPLMFTLQPAEVSAVKWIDWREYIRLLQTNDPHHIRYQYDGNYARLFKTLEERESRSCGMGLPAALSVDAVNRLEPHQQDREADQAVPLQQLHPLSQESGSWHQQQQQQQQLQQWQQQQRHQHQQQHQQGQQQQEEQWQRQQEQRYQQQRPQQVQQQQKQQEEVPQENWVPSEQLEHQQWHQRQAQNFSLWLPSTGGVGTSSAGPDVNVKCMTEMNPV